MPNKASAKTVKTQFVDPKMEAIVNNAPTMSGEDEERALRLLSDMRGRKITLDRPDTKSG